MIMQQQKLKKIATPPRRGKGLECRCRSWVGTATHPREVAKSRTYRVSTKADNKAEKNNPNKMKVNYTTSTHPRARKRTAQNSASKYRSDVLRLVVSEKIPVDAEGASTLPARAGYLQLPAVKKAVENQDRA